MCLVGTTALGCSGSDEVVNPGGGSDAFPGVIADVIDAENSSSLRDTDRRPRDPCVNCDDGNPCTSDDCGPDGGCTHSWVDGCCYGDDECGDGLFCIDNVCTYDPQSCQTVHSQIPDSLTILEWHSDSGTADISKQTWTVTDDELPMQSVQLYEAVRFELEHPAKIHGFSVRYAQLPAEPGAAVSAGLYPDFGYNGFDFWDRDPLWEGSHCAEAIAVDDWVEYAFTSPVHVEHPGLVYVAHQRAGEGDAAWWFDGSTNQEDGSCAGFDDCHSSLRFPKLKQGVSGGQGFAFWQGLTFPFQYDFIVRLHVEYMEGEAPAADLFQPMVPMELPNRASFGDWDNDGDDDVFVAGNILWRNEGGDFVDVTDQSGIPAMGISGSGGIFGDFDNDGCLDIFVFVESGTSPNHLLRGGCDGTFEDVTTLSTLTDAQSYNDCNGAGHGHAPAASAAWLDIDNDGLLDLYIANMICWADFTFYNDQVWRNNGDNTFSEWTGQNGFTGSDMPPRSSRGANPIDYDQDGDVDLFVNRYTLHENALYRNNGDGTVTSVADDVGVAGQKSNYYGNTYYGHSIGASWGDIDNDGDFDLVVANLAHPRFFGFSDKSQVLIQEDGVFSDSQGDFQYPEGAAGLRFQETHSVPNLGDFDNDGALDLAISATYDGRPTDFYYGQGDGTFRLSSYRSGLDFTNGWGIVHSDVDHDGDLDLFTSGGAYRNTRLHTGRWLQIRVVGTDQCNRAAIGATVGLSIPEGMRVGYVSGGNGQGGQDSQTVHFGLGPGPINDVVNSIRVDFPGAGTVIFEGPFDTNQRLWLYEDGKAHSGFSPPDA